MTRRSTTATGLRYAIYARTAAGGQVAVDSQVQAARALISKRGDDVLVVEHKDINISGNHAPGPGLTALLDEVARGRVDAVVLTDITRLGRCGERVRQVLAAFKRGSARLVMAGEVG